MRLILLLLAWLVAGTAATNTSTSVWEEDRTRDIASFGYSTLSWASSNLLWIWQFLDSYRYIIAGIFVVCGIPPMLNYLPKYQTMYREYRSRSASPAQTASVERKASIAKHPHVLRHWSLPNSAYKLYLIQFPFLIERLPLGFWAPKDQILWSGNYIAIVRSNRALEKETEHWVWKDHVREASQETCNPPYQPVSNATVDEPTWQNMVRTGILYDRQATIDGRRKTAPRGSELGPWMNKYLQRPISPDGHYFTAFEYNSIDTDLQTSL